MIFLIGKVDDALHRFYVIEPTHWYSFITYCIIRKKTPIPTIHCDFGLYPSEIKLNFRLQRDIVRIRRFGLRHPLDRRAGYVTKKD